MNLTDRQSASGVSASDLIHIVIPSDTSQSPSGSSYKVEIGDYSSVFTGNQNNFVRDLVINVYDLPVNFTAQDVCNYINALPTNEKTIVDTDSKWNVLIVSFTS